MFLITGGWGWGEMGEGGGGGTARPSQVEVTGAGICANQLSIGRDRDVVYKKIKEKRGRASRMLCPTPFLKGGGGGRGGGGERKGEKTRRAPN